MFPIVAVSIRGLEPEKMYTVELSFDQIDAHRWRYVSGQWQAGTKPDPPVPRAPYQHPDSPNYGETWMRDTVSFSKVKLTNKTNQTGPCQVRNTTKSTNSQTINSRLYLIHFINTNLNCL
jgi:brachyury protein